MPKKKTPQEFELDLQQLVAIFDKIKREDHWEGIRMHVVTRRPCRWLRWRSRSVATMDIELTAKGRKKTEAVGVSSGHPGVM